MSFVAEPADLFAYPAGVPSLAVCRLTVTQYLDMVRTGILAEDTPIELLDGWLVPKMTKSAMHLIVMRRIRRALDAMTDGIRWFVNTETSSRLSTSVLEPAIAVIRGSDEDYLRHIPTAQDLPLVVEIADTSLRRDRTVKKAVYARDRIPVYWIADLVAKQIEVFAEPTGEGDTADYGNREVYKPGDMVPVVLDGVEVGKIAVAEVLP